MSPEHSDRVAPPLRGIVVSGSSQDSWYCRDADGTVTGPHPLAGLRLRAERAELEPGTQVSRDRREWTSVENLPELQMVWLVERTDGSFYGPLNLQAVKRLIHDGILSPAARTVKKEPDPAAASYDRAGKRDVSTVQGPEDDTPEGLTEDRKPGRGEKAARQRALRALQAQLDRRTRERDEARRHLEESHAEAARMAEALERGQRELSAAVTGRDKTVPMLEEARARIAILEGELCATRRKQKARETELEQKVSELEQELGASRARAAARKTVREGTTGAPAAQQRADKPTRPAIGANGDALTTRLRQQLVEQQKTIADLQRRIEEEERVRKREAAQHKTGLKEAAARAEALEGQIRKQEEQRESTDRWINEQRSLYKKQLVAWKARELQLTAENEELQRHHQQALRNLEQALSMFSEGGTNGE